MHFENFNVVSYSPLFFLTVSIKWRENIKNLKELLGPRVVVELFI